MVDPAVLTQRRSVISEDNIPYFKETSSLNKYCICNTCNKRFATKYVLPKHFKSCEAHEYLKCQWCNIVFANRGNLMSHTKNVHNDLVSIKNGTPVFKPVAKENSCIVCNKRFRNSWTLKVHIRREHFNLTAKILPCDMKKVNQVWFEKVLNTNAIMEIKKTGQNVLVMRKLGPNTAIKVQEIDHPITDLTPIYPFTKSLEKEEKRVECNVCHKTFQFRCLAKHIQEKHLNLQRHYCANCDLTFKRSYLFVRHVCFKTKKYTNKRQKTVPDIRTRLLSKLPFKNCKN